MMTLGVLEIVLTSSESDRYSSAPKEISKLSLTHMTGYFCRSVYWRGSLFYKATHCDPNLQDKR